MKSKSLLGFALALGICGLLGCKSLAPQDPCNAVVTALNNENWAALREMTPTDSHARGWIDAWERHPVRVGKLMDTREGSAFGQPCTIYSFALQNKDGTVNPHWLQIAVRKLPHGKTELVDFWNFGW